MALRASLPLLAALIGVGLTPADKASAAEPKCRPNIVVLIADDQRPDTVAALGNRQIQTPNLDRLAHEGVAFTRAVCANPICHYSRSEILTGVSSMTNGVLQGPINPQLTTWAQTLQSAGYHTWYVGKWHNDGRPITRGYEQTLGLYLGGGGKWAIDAVDWQGFKITGYRGWVFQNDQGQMFPERGVGLTPNISAKFADAAIEFIQRKPQRPFFLHVNFTAPHDPLLMPPGYQGKYRAADMPLPKNFLPRHPFDHGNFDGRDEQLMHWPRTPEAVRAQLAMYYSVISYLDAQVGRILKALDVTGQADNTIVFYTSDHGLAIGSHGLRGKQNMYEHTINVPLLVRGPDVPKNQRRDAAVYLRDLYPTTCEMAGVAIPETVEGRSFASVLQGKKKSIYPYIFGYFRNVQRMIRTDRWKLIYYPHIDRWQLFDLQNDPDELYDLAGDAKQKDVLRDLRGKLLAWRKEVNDPTLAKTAAPAPKP